MRAIITNTLILLFAFSFSTFAATTPQVSKHPVPQFSKIKAKDLERFTGKKQSVWQKLQWKLLQSKWVRKALQLGQEPITDQQKKQATLSLIFGIVGFVFLFLFAPIGLVAAILAVIFGLKSIKGNSNTKGIIGLALGATTIFIALLAIVLVAAFIASWGG